MNIQKFGDLKRIFSDFDFESIQKNTDLNFAPCLDNGSFLLGFESEDIENIYYRQKAKKIKLDCFHDNITIDSNVHPQADQTDDKNIKELICAIWSKNQQLVESLILQCKDLNKSVYYRIEKDLLHEAFATDINVTEMTPLSAAISRYSTKVIKLLIDHKVNVNQRVEIFLNKQYTPLEMAVQADFKEGIDLLSKGSNLYQINRDGHNLLFLAKMLNAKKSIKKLSTLGLSAKLANEFIDRIGLATIWGINGNLDVADESGHKRSVTIAGLYQPHSTKLMNRYWNSFLRSENLNGDQKKRLKFTKKSLIEDTTYEVIQRKVSRGVPCVIQKGFFGHSIAYVLIYGFLAICNRGQASNTEKTTQTFSLPPSKMTPELISKLLHIYPNKESYLQMINTLNLTECTDFNEKQKLQKGPTCATSCQKAALHFIIKRIFPKEGQAVYKKFTSYLRNKSFNCYKKIKYRRQDFKLIKFIEEKQAIKIMKSNEMEHDLKYNSLIV